MSPLATGTLPSIFIPLTPSTGLGTERVLRGIVLNEQGCQSTSWLARPSDKTSQMPWAVVNAVSTTQRVWIETSRTNKAVTNRAFTKKGMRGSPGRIAQLVRASSSYVKVAGSISVQGTQKKQPMNA